MLTYPNIDPVAFHILSWPVYWYGLMYLFGFLGGWGVLAMRVSFSPRGFTRDELSDIVFFVALGAIIGGRCGYMLFYAWQDWFTHPLSLFKTWKGGMSFHGGALGVAVAMAISAKKFNKHFLAISDLICPAVPIGLATGRFGNFINGELWGRITNAPWGMVFPNAGELPRHPSQLYELGLEGIFLFAILWLYSRKPRPLGAVSGLFAILYGVFRIFVEFYREPDAPIGFIAGGATEGQLLSIPLVLVGIILLVRAYQKKQVVDIEKVNREQVL